MAHKEVICACCQSRWDDCHQLHCVASEQVIFTDVCEDQESRETVPVEHQFYRWAVRRKLLMQVSAKICRHLRENSNKMLTASLQKSTSRFFCLFVCFVLRERVCTTSQDKNLLICFEMLKPSWDCQKEQLQHLRCVLELMWFWTKPVGGLNIFGGLYLRFLSFKGQSAQTCTYVLRAAGVCVCVCVSVCVSAFYYVRKKRKQELDRERRWSGDQSVSDSAGECVCVCVCVCRGGVIEQIA